MDYNWNNEKHNQCSWPNSWGMINGIDNQCIVTECVGITNSSVLLCIFRCCLGIRSQQMLRVCNEQHLNILTSLSCWILYDDWMTLWDYSNISLIKQNFHLFIFKFSKCASAHILPFEVKGYLPSSSSTQPTASFDFFGSLKNTLAISYYSILYK